MTMNLQLQRRRARTSRYEVRCRRWRGFGFKLRRLDLMNKEEERDLMAGRAVVVDHKNQTYEWRVVDSHSARAI